LRDLDAGEGRALGRRAASEGGTLRVRVSSSLARVLAMSHWPPKRSTRLMSGTGSTSW
jgi:hypothetical protein